ncbi:MAG: hypothetical protein FJ102_06455 [Deltaproteobacteria bacterium]|nr:hypothetical protein [Deltaproteobacteria bacterium]
MNRATLLLLPLLLGCHAKFKKYAPTLGSVRSQVVDTGVPYVSLGATYVGGPPVLEVASAVVNTVQAVRSIEQTDRIARAVDPNAVANSLVEGVRDTLGSGPPFAFTDSPDAPLLQITVESYGLFVPYIGAPGVFTYNLGVHIYTREGERVYTNSVECATDAGAGEPVERVLAVVDNVAKLDSMSDAEINDAFVQIGRYCGSVLVQEMRQHAG